VIGAIIAAGFFASAPVRTALAVGAAVAVVSGPLGVFTVIRGQSFAGEALGDIGITGGSGAFLVGVGPLWGFLVFNVVATALMELVGIQRRRGRDLATGVVLGAGLGVAALFLYLDTTIHNTTGAAVTVLFGSLFTVQASLIPLIALLAVVVLGLLATVARPLLLSSASPELAAARGVPVSVMGYVYLLALSVSVAALRIVRRPLVAMATATGLGILATWIGTLLAYDSYDWPPQHRGWPVSFFVVALVFVTYLACGVVSGRRGRRPADPAALAPPVTLGG
jgi:zinc/manganese transport system permease protein